MQGSKNASSIFVFAKNEMVIISLQKKQNQVQKRAYRAQMPGKSIGHNNYFMQNEDTVKQISKLTSFLEKLTNQFDKYFRSKRMISEKSESQKSKMEQPAFSSNQNFDNLKQKKSKGNSPKPHKPRENKEFRVQDMDDEIRSRQAEEDTSNIFIDRSKKKREEKDPAPAQQLPATLQININSNHNSSNHNNGNPPPQSNNPPQPLQNNPPQPPSGPPQGTQPSFQPANPPPNIIPANIPSNPASIPNPDFIQTYPNYNPPPNNNQPSNPNHGYLNNQINHNNGNINNQGNPNNNTFKKPTISGCSACSCLLFLFGFLKLMGGIAMVVVGGIKLSEYSGSSTYCPSPYTYSNGQCCYYYTYTNSYYNYNYCYKINVTQDSGITTGIILVSVGAFAVIVGIILLFQSCRVYSDNDHVIFCRECC